MGRMYYGRYCWGLYRALPPFSRLNLKKNEKEGKFEGISSFWVRHDMTQTFTLTIHTQTHLISPSTSWATMHVHFLLISLAACIATAARHQNLRAAEPDVERLIDTINPKGQLLSGNTDAGSPANSYFAQAEKEQANAALTAASSFEAAHGAYQSNDVLDYRGAAMGDDHQEVAAAAQTERKLINDRTTNAFSVAYGDGDDGEDGDDDDDGEDDEEDGEEETDDGEAFQAAGGANVSRRRRSLVSCSFCRFLVFFHSFFFTFFFYSFLFLG